MTTLVTPALQLLGLGSAAILAFDELQDLVRLLDHQQENRDAMLQRDVDPL